MIDPNRIYTVQEVADLLVYSAASVRKWITDSELSAYQLGNREYRISGIQLTDFLQSREKKRAGQGKPSALP